MQLALYIYVMKDIFLSNSAKGSLINFSISLKPYIFL